MAPYSEDLQPTNTPPLNRLAQFQLYRSFYALAVARQEGDETRTFGLLLALASTYAKNGVFPQAISNLELALSLTRRHANRQQEGGIMVTLAELHNATGEREIALEHYRQALCIAEELDDDVLKRISLDGLRHTKTALTVDTLNRRDEEFLPTTVAHVDELNDAARLSLRMGLAVGLFVVSFVLLPIILSQAGLSDGIIAVTVIMAGLLNFALFRQLAAA